MSAGTIVIAGGILAGVILLCIVAVLCYCRLQYYCCKKNVSEAARGPGPAPAPASATLPDALPDPLSHFPCDTCNALANDGAAIPPVSLDQLDAAAPPCRACSPYAGRAAPQMLNGGERLGFHTYYEKPLPLGYVCPAPPLRPYSTQEVPTKKAKLRESRLQLMEDDPLNKCQMENHRLQQASLRLEQENDNLAQRLITSKVALRSALDKAEDSVEELTGDLLLTRRQLQATEEEKRGKEEEAAMLKEVLRRELERAEQEVKRSAGIIADYKQICSQLTTRLEKQQDAHLEEVRSLENAAKACPQCRRHDGQTAAGESDASPALSPPPEWDRRLSGPSEAQLRRENQEKESLRAQIRQLEKELAQTKLQVVEANCKIQELEHERGILANDLQDARNNWISKAFTSLRTSADGGPHGGALSGWKLPWPHKDGRENT
ncbi:rab GTPase-activating protein 1-like isoform X2 [Syngnathoides biaculeatus]|uniref:rab GTPase-activating protein 1-like isoform X2 n=1 Tax=Syngnathoides biaculeatus TaxID=300417 RepID=UPI002ADE3163|nr:rab GTPase-activating protein 1-like isoform X2 [Syngnathoides biaculeatus]